VVDKEFLGELVEVGESDERIGVVGPKIYYYNEPDRIWFAGGKINWWKGTANHVGLRKSDKGQFNELKEVDYISGCALLIKRNAIRDVGILDRRYFTYFEDTEWNIRFKKEGYGIVYAPNAFIYHKVALTTSKTGVQTLYYAHRNRILFFKKYCPKKYLIVLPFALFGRFIIALGYYTACGKMKHSAAIIRAYWDGLFRLS
jgi:GT2 family glycosyltransferase